MRTGLDSSLKYTSGIRSKNLRVNLEEINGKGQLGGKDFLEAEGVEENGNADSSNIQQKHSMQKMPLVRGGFLHENQKVNEKSQKVFRPKVEDFNHLRTDFVKHFVFLRSALSSTSSGAKPSERKPGSDHDVREKNKHGFHDLA